MKIKGFPAWWLHRMYHLSKMPTTRRKVQVLTDWTIAFLLTRDITRLWSTQLDATFGSTTRRVSSLVRTWLGSAGTSTR